MSIFDSISFNTNTNFDHEVLKRVVFQDSVYQPPGRGPVPGPGINYIVPREILLELITNLNEILYLSTCHTIRIIVLILFMIMPQLIINIYVSLMYEPKKKLESY